MSIRDQLEVGLRERVRRNLEASREPLVELIRAPITDGTTGQLRAGIQVDPWQENGDTYTTTARSLAPHSIYLDEGTGIYGPRGEPITPTTQPLLKFFWEKQGEWRSMKSVRGTQPIHFFRQPMADNFRTALRDAWGA